MFQKKITFVIFFSLSATTIFTDAQHFWRPQQPSLRFFNNAPIKLKPGSYEAFIARWENRLNKSWDNFYKKLNVDTGLSPAEFEAFLQDEALADIYGTLKEKELLKTYQKTEEKNIDPDVLNFIQRTVQKHCSKKNIKIIISPNINTITATFGSDNHTHYLICHASIYSTENIKHFYDSLTDNNGAFYIESSSENNIRAIELSNFLLIGLIEAASHIEHQSNLQTFIISSFKFSGKSPSEEAVLSCKHITETRGIIESIIQSKNPLESALFIGKSKNRNAKERALWKSLVKEIADCYEPESLESFKAAMLEIKRLYKA